MQRVFVQFPHELLKRIDALAGENNRAEFIRDATSAEVKRRERAAKRDGQSDEDGR